MSRAYEVEFAPLENGDSLVKRLVEISDDSTITEDAGCWDYVIITLALEEETGVEIPVGLNSINEIIGHLRNNGKTVLD